MKANRQVSTASTELVTQPTLTTLDNAGQRSPDVSHTISHTTDLKNHTTVVYFIENMVTGDVKIGCAQSAARRIQYLASDLPLAIVMELPGDKRTEEFLHSALGAFRLKGEWFQGGPHLWSRLADILRQPNEMLNCAKVDLVAGAAICDQRARGSIAPRTEKTTPPTPHTHTTPPTPLLPATYFKHQGREYRLFKRQLGRDAPWYFEFERAGKRFKTSCKTNTTETAIAKAKSILDAADKKELAQVRGILSRRDKPAAYCTIGQLLTAFDRAPLDVGAQHRRNCINCFRLVLARAQGTETGDVDQLSAQVLTADTGRQYFEAWLARAKACQEQDEEARAKRSANSIWRQAVCVLAPRLLAIYARQSLTLPDVEPFLKSGKLERFSASTTEIYNPPADSVIIKTLAGWRRLDDRNMFLAVGLELACGLRKQEVAQVTWGMFKRSMAAPLLDGRGWVKNQTGAFQVLPIDPFWRVLNKRIDKEGWRGQDGDLVLTGTATDREDIHFRNIGQWMRDLGWETEKTNHALRAYAGSLVAMKYGIYRASCWLRHRSIKTTEGHYSHFINRRVFNPDRVFIRWAT